MRKVISLTDRQHKLLEMLRWALPTGIALSPTFLSARLSTTTRRLREDVTALVRAGHPIIPTGSGLVLASTHSQASAVFAVARSMRRQASALLEHADHLIVAGHALDRAEIVN